MDSLPYKAHAIASLIRVRRPRSKSLGKRLSRLCNPDCTAPSNYPEKGCKLCKKRLLGAFLDKYLTIAICPPNAGGTDDPGTRPIPGSGGEARRSITSFGPGAGYG